LRRPNRTFPGPFCAEFWRGPLRGPWLTSFLGTLLVPAIAVIAVTGFVSHWAYYPELPGNATTPPGSDIPVLFHIPASWPSWSYAVNQGLHVTLGLITLPLILAKLWTVMPKLFQRPIFSSFAGWSSPSPLTAFSAAARSCGCSPGTWASWSLMT